MRAERGFTLLEMLFSVSILSVVSLLGFIVVRSSYESQSLIEAQGEIQSDLRSVMAALTAELELAFAEPRIISVRNPDGVEPIKVATDGKSVVYYRPVPDNSAQGFTWQGPFTLMFENEDTDDGSGGNAKLDSGEDVNGDGVLNRRVVRIANGVSTPLGGANNIRSVQFELLDSADASDDRDTRLRIRLEAGKRYGVGTQMLALQELESEIRFLN